MRIEDFHHPSVARSVLVNQPLTRFILPSDQNIYHRCQKQMVATGESHSFEIHLLRSGDYPFWAKLQANLSKNSEGKEVFRVMADDISVRKEMEKRISLSVAMFENASEGFLVTDAQERILIINQAFVALTGYSADEVLGKTPRILSSGRQSAAFYEKMWVEINVKGRWQGEIWNRRKNGEVYPQLLSVSAIFDDDNQISHYVAVFYDISQLKEATAKLEYQAQHDALTGLPNRLLLFTRLQHCIDVSQRERKRLSILMLDLDRFKDINDSLGHLAGDELLQQVAKRLAGRLRGIDTVTRLGGDEFTVLLEDLQDPQDAAQVAKDLIDAINEPWLLSNGIEVRIGVSIGISLFPEHGRTPEELLKQADSAMYHAKEEGRGNFKYYTDDLTQAAILRINMETRLRQAISNQGLRLHYQPQIDIASGRIVGAEALVRMVDALDGLTGPSQFIPVAEKAGLVVPIGEWVLRETCRQGKRWIEAGLPKLILCVNVSVHQLRQSDICATVADILIETGFPAERLELELTESALMERETETVQKLMCLRALGVLLAIDDFGTGYSSLTYLKRFPLDLLKIDKSFIDDIPQLQDDREITSAIIALGHILRLKVLAEGVETAEQFDFLRKQGCDSYQGFIFSPPVTAEAFEVLLRRQAGQYHPL